MTARQALSIPDADFTMDLVQGSHKQIKSTHRRNDSTSWVAPDEVHVIPGLNVRLRTPQYLERVRAIADSIKADGFKLTRPLIVFVHHDEAAGEDRIYVQDGHTRLEALQTALSEGAQIDQVPVLFMPKGTSIEDITADLIVANEGEPLSAYEKALVVKRLANAGLNNVEIARRINMTSTHVANLLVLSSAPHAVVKMIVDGQVSPSTAISALREHGSKAVAILREAAGEAGGQEGAAPGKGAGKKVVTSAVSAKAAYEKAARRWAPDLVTTLSLVRKDPGYARLDTGTRGLIDKLVEQVEAMRQEIEAKFGKKAAKAVPGLED
jgi:ParB-like chromosome segregation protein Spo0J